MNDKGEISVGGHELSLHGKTRMRTVTLEHEAGRITSREWAEKAKEIFKEDQAECRKSCCQPKRRKK